MSSVNPQENNVPQNDEIRVDDSEKNLVKQRRYYEKQLEQERMARQAAEDKIAQFAQQNLNKAPVDVDDDDDSDEPYVDRRRLEKRLGKVVKQVGSDTDTKIQNAVQQALAAERRTQWLRNNPDFQEVMSHAQAFADRDPELAETILEMPDGFERQKLVYKNIKALGIHKKPEDQPKIQDKIDQNLRSPYYQPTGVAAPGYGVYNGGRNITPAEGHNAYKKMQELKGRLRI